jgi:hypothetical protein
MMMKCVTGGGLEGGSETNRLYPEDCAIHEWYRFVLSFPAHLVRDYLERFSVNSTLRMSLVPSLAGSLAPHGVTVNAVAPALIAATGMLPGNADEERALTLRIPVGRLGRPEEVAEAILSFVANPFITGQTLLIDGGIYPR